jgi:hypothetical protein
VGLVASVVVGSWVWQWWLAGWWELIVPPPNANAVAATPARLLEVSAYAPPEPVQDEVYITPLPAGVDLSPAAPVEPRPIELSPQ